MKTANAPKDLWCEYLILQQDRIVKCGVMAVGSVSVLSDEYGGIRLSPRCREHLNEYRRQRANVHP
jgi:hypothetical protein